MNALTDTDAGLKRMIPLRTHGQADAIVLAGLTLLSASKMIRGDKKDLVFHLAFLSAAFTNFLLTDYHANEKNPGK